MKERSVEERAVPVKRQEEEMVEAMENKRE